MLIAVGSLGDLCCKVCAALLTHLQPASLHVEDLDLQNAVEEVFSVLFILSIALAFLGFKDFDQLCRICGGLVVRDKALHPLVVAFKSLWALLRLVLSSSLHHDFVSAAA